jgi:hypothetical protein
MPSPPARQRLRADAAGENTGLDAQKNAQSPRPSASSGGRGRRKHSPPIPALHLIRLGASVASLSDGSIGDAVPNTRPDRAHDGAFGAIANGRPWLAGRPPDGRAARPAYLAYATGRDGGRLETAIAGGRPGNENTGKKCNKKHGLYPRRPTRQSIRTRLAHHARAINLASPRARSRRDTICR